MNRRFILLNNKRQRLMVQPMKKIYLSLMILFSLSIQANTTVYMPTAIQQQLITATQKQLRSACEQPHPPLNYTVYALAQQLLLFVHLPDEACQSRSVLAVSFKQGQWQTGEVLDSIPSALHITANKQLWLISHWESEGVLPYLHSSTDGIHWQNIPLPDTKTLDCCFVYLKQLCVSSHQLQIKLTGTEETNQQYWSSPLEKTQNWQTTSALTACTNTELGFDDWQQSTHDKHIWLTSKKRQLKIILPRWLN